MRKLLVAFALVLAACGGSSTEQAAAPALEGDESTSSTAVTPSSTTAATSVPQVSPDAGSVAVDEPADAVSRPRPEGPDAPDFILTLGQGGEFSPSAEDKPIYMVFWAEW